MAGNERYLAFKANGDGIVGTYVVGASRGTEVDDGRSQVTTSRAATNSRNSTRPSFSPEHPLETALESTLTSTRVSCFARKRQFILYLQRWIPEVSPLL